MTDLEVLWRVVFPTPDRLDTAPLYADTRRARTNPSQVPGREAEAEAPVDVLDAAVTHNDWFTSRRSLTLPAGHQVSLAAYFNAFPAAYWRHWTTVREVTLRLDVEGHGMVAVQRSTASGAVQRVETVAVDGGRRTVEVPISIQRFADGGWLWFDLLSGAGDLVLHQADWMAPALDREAGRATLEITTMNKPSYCSANLAKLAEHTELLERLDEVLVVDQGDQLVEDDPGFAAAAEALGGKLRVIRQSNLGGSGGFARGMSEAVQNGSTWVLLMDDDIRLEPESLVRLMTFSDRCARPTLVGAHMFDLHDPTVLHAYGEAIDRFRWHYAAAPGVERGEVDFRVESLRNTRSLHRRIDVDYNGWWMDLIPTSVIREIGLSLPIFIKWDDAEYGIRAQKAGYATVTLPGAAVWHESWLEKEDLIGWQGYFHARNRLITGLLHSEAPKGGRLLLESFNLNVKHLLAMEYYTEAIRSLGFEDVLAGPEHLFGLLERRIKDVRAMAADYTDAQLKPEASDFPDPRPRDIPNFTRLPEHPRTRDLLPVAARMGIKRFLDRERPENAASPQQHLPHTRKQWWRLAGYDSVLASSADGLGVRWYQRRPDVYRAEMARTVRLVTSLVREWDDLRRRYRAAQPDLVSLDAWAKVFDEHTVGETRP